MHTKLIIFKITLLSLFFNGYSQIQDGMIDDPGDIVFVGYFYNGPSGNDEGFAFLFLDDCPVGQTIRFDDDEWTGSSFATANGEGQVLWENTTGDIIKSGTVITINNPSNNSGFPISASLGVATEDNAGFTLTLDDQIYAYTGTRDMPGTFLSFIGEDESLSEDAATLNGTGLVNGQTAFVINNGGYYSGNTNCESNATTCAEMITNMMNWTLGDFSFPNGIPTNFTNTENSSTLGVVDIAKPYLNVSLYPNPTTSMIHISTKEKINAIEVTTPAGIVMSAVYNKNTINISNLNAALYFVKVVTDNSVLIRKIIKE